MSKNDSPDDLKGAVALVTGAAGGIGKAIAARLLRDGGRVIMTDINRDTLASATEALAAEFGEDKVFHTELNVVDEDSVARAFAEGRQNFGQINIVVSNAGIAFAAPLTETAVDDWDRCMDILGKGYFLVSREALRFFTAQGTGGNIVFIGSKNGLTASVNASAYCAAKAAEVNLARCVALEGAAVGVRANTVSTEAVIRGSAIWDGPWRAERAAAYGVEPDQLEEYYRNRTLLKQSILPEDVADAVAFFASDRSIKMTGNILSVDGGNQLAFAR
ncbi:SDR family oxidoreductase [Paracoccaceae bacterium GXU_MW_L88]